MPLSLLSNRLCTAEFFGSCSRALEPGGMVALALPLGQARLVPGQAAILGPILAAGMQEFLYCRVVPLGGALLLMSDSPLAPPSDVAASRWGALAPVHPLFLDSTTLQWEVRPDRLEGWLAGSELAGGRPNSDLRPSAFLAATEDWYARMGRSGRNAAIPAVLGASGLLLAFTMAMMGRRAGIALVPCALGMSSAAAETASILVVQATLGISWTVLALSPALFMCGYAIGSSRMPRLAPRTSGIAGSVSVAGFGGVCSLYSSGAIGPLPLVAGAAASVLIAGAFSGSLFPASADLVRGGARGAMLVNAAAVAGSAMGAVAFPLLLFPTVGATATLLWTGAAALAVSLSAAPARARAERGLAAGAR
jgi:hypothetical protein